MTQACNDRKGLGYRSSYLLRLKLCSPSFSKFTAPWSISPLLLPACGIHLSVKYRATFEINISSEPLYSIYKPFYRQEHNKYCLWCQSLQKSCRMNSTDGRTALFPLMRRKKRVSTAGITLQWCLNMAFLLWFHKPVLLCCNQSHRT